jgi:hypothetical protein
MWKKLAVIGVPAVALILGATGRADAGPVNLVTNGGFEDNTGGGQLTTTVTATGWTMGTSQSPGYAFLFAPGTADTTGAGSSGFVLAGPGNNNGHGPQNGLDLSPNGGYFAALGADGKDLVLEPLTQTINNLTAGDTYQVTFYWAGAQQESLGLGATTDQLVVGFGSVSQGFTGWMTQTFFFTADSTSDVLSFMAVGTPAGLPPFVLLDGVSLMAVPEPPTLGLMGAGLIGLGIAALRRRRTQNVSV